jgi:hypothetical protein
MLKKVRIPAIVLFVLFNLTDSKTCAADNVVVVYDLRDDWLIYDARSNSYVPFVGNNIGKPTISFPLYMERYQNSRLYIHAPEGTSVFFDQKMVAYEDTGTGFFFDIDSLRANHSAKSLLITLYNPRFSDEGHLQTNIVRFRAQEYAGNAAPFDPLQFMRRDTGEFVDFFVLALILLLIFFAIIMNAFNKRMQSFYNLGRAFSFNFREESTFFKGKVFDRTNLPILMAHSLLISFIAIVVIISIDNTKLVINNFIAALAHWSVLALGIFGFFILKYWLLAVVGSLFRLPFINRHYLEYVRLSKIFFAAVFVLLVVLYMGFNMDLERISLIVINILILFVILRVFVLYFKFMGSSPFNNLYLFSYLCSTEVLPMVVGLKILLDR